MTDLIQPVKQGQTLIEEIGQTQPAAGSIAVWWLGQSGFLIKSRLGMAVIDPYLSEHLTHKYAGTNRPHIRMTAAPLRPAELRGLDLVLASHKHSDHLDPGTLPELLRAAPRALLILPEALHAHALSLGLPAERLVGIDAGGVREIAGFQVRALPSAHEAIETDSAGRHLYLGYVIEVDGLRLYHSGDCVRYDGLEENLGAGPFDVLFLPVNGRDPARGVPGNMSAAEAVELAARVRPRFLVPHHFDMFTFNTIPITVFEQAARRLPAQVVARALRCGERWVVHTGAGSEARHAGEEMSRWA